MTHCGDKWERMFESDPESCDMVEDYRRKVQKHLSTLKKIRARGITVTVKTFPEGAHRELPKEDDDIYPDALDYVCHCLERGEKVTAGDLKSTVKAYREKACPSCAIAKNNTNVLSAPTNTDEKPTSSGEVLADRLKDKPHGSSAFHTAAQELVAKKNGIAGEMFPDGNYLEIPDSSIPAWTPALCKTGPCPDGRSHTTHDKVRGIVCEQTGQPINQISKCPIIIRMTAAEAGGFVPETLDFPIGPAIWVWDYDHLPEAVRSWMKEQDCSFDDLDWVAIVPPEYKDQYINWLEEPVFGCCSVHRLPLSPEGHEIVMGYHS